MLAVRHDSPRQQHQEPGTALGQGQPKSTLDRERADRCSCPPVLSSTPEDFKETPSSLALVLSLPNNEQLLVGTLGIKTKPNQTKNPTHILTRKLQPSVLFGSCGFQTSITTTSSIFPRAVKDTACVFVSISDCKHEDQLKINEYYFASEKIFSN